MPSCSFMDYNTYITWKHLEKNFGPTFQVRLKNMHLTPWLLIHVHIFAVCSCPRWQLIDHTNLNRVIIFLTKIQIFYIKENVLKYKSYKCWQFYHSIKLSGQNVELITYIVDSTVEYDWQGRMISTKQTHMVVQCWAGVVNDWLTFDYQGATSWVCSTWALV